ncbi:hypothetical protein MA16_Dca024055 [Dendrobium catenatum]|uniref:Uncharacterized protein n=1 Tax=Dendrobium catenatum TaxID=906689 RepID=A0A2I0VG68_9ASPA|nr:hypothetical protein MA16_Dca024055 [Dendrobium catenatum]
MRTFSIEKIERITVEKEREVMSVKSSHGELAISLLCYEYVIFIGKVLRIAPHVPKFSYLGGGLGDRTHGGEANVEQSDYTRETDRDGTKGVRPGKGRLTGWGREDSRDGGFKWVQLQVARMG